MQTKFLQVSNYFKESIQTFEKSSSELDTSGLEELVTLIDNSYGAGDNEFRKMQDAALTQKKDIIGWKKYILSLFQVMYFSENIKKETLERLIIEIGQSINKNANFNEISTEELICLYVANTCCLLDKSFPAKLKNGLGRTYDKLFSIHDENKSKNIETSTNI
jgi:hypothetical protein